MNCFTYLQELAKTPTDSNFKVVGKSTTYSTPLFWNPIETMRSKEDHRFDQNQKKLREKRNMRWSRYFRVKFV
jgi:hypothetical protein